MRFTSNRFLSHVACAHAIALCVINPATAAPTLGELAASASTSGAPPRDHVDAVSTVQSRPPSAAQTVDMLIDLQPRAAGLTFNERAPVGDRALRTGAAGGAGADAGSTRAATDAREPASAGSRSSSADILRSGLFGTGATPQVVSQQRMSATHASMPGAATRSVGDAPPAHAVHGSRAELPGWMLWPREVVLFVRENRDWVVGGVLALFAAFGAMSMLRGRNQRH